MRAGAAVVVLSGRLSVTESSSATVEEPLHLVRWVPIHGQLSVSVVQDCCGDVLMSGRDLHRTHVNTRVNRRDHERVAQAIGSPIGSWVSA